RSLISGSVSLHTFDRHRIIWHNRSLDEAAHQKGAGLAQMDPTERVPLGGTGLSVTRLGLGTAPLGGLFREVPEDQAVGVGQRARAAGLRFFDTAPIYGTGPPGHRPGSGLCHPPRAPFRPAT